MDSEIYLDRNTFFHRLDPRTKIIILLTTFVVVLYYQNPLWVLPISALVLLHGILSDSLVNLKRIRYIMFVLSVSGLILWNLFASGETKLFWIFTLESLAYSLDRVLIMLTLITAGMIFMSTTRNEEFVLGMIRLGLPYRVGFAISTALRLVPTIVGSVFIIAQAQRSRGLDLDSGNLYERFKKYLPLLVPVFVSTIRNTNVFGMALEAKGFGAKEERTFYMDIRMKSADYWMLALMLVIFVVTTYLKVRGYGNIPGLIGSSGAG